MSDAPTSNALAHPNGLTTTEAKKLLAQYGPNTLSQKKKSAVLKFLKWFFAPIPLMLIAAAVLSFINGKEADAGLIALMLFANYLIQVWHEHKADQAVEKLEGHLATYARAQRDGKWQRVAADQIVPGDRIALRVGALVPADAQLVSSENLSLNESMLTGESLPREKGKGDTVYSASYVATGSGEATVTATGNDTYFGAAVKTLDTAKKRSALEEDILSISKLLAVLALLAIAVLTTVLLLNNSPWNELATLDISLLIAGIPVALPTVMSLIISAGVQAVARSGAAVRRLSSLEDLANVNLLLSDKTGTLTQNKIHVTDVELFGNWEKHEALRLATSATDSADGNPLEGAVRDAAKEAEAETYKQSDFTPGDSKRKRSTAVIDHDGETWVVSLGAPPTVAELSRFDGDTSERFKRAVDGAADRGDRALLLSIGKNTKDEKKLEPVAVLFLADALREDAAETIAAMHHQGIDVKMLTGDGLPIAKEVARTLGLSGELYNRSVFDDPQHLKQVIRDAAGFAEVLPKDKYAAVEAGKAYARVAVTGDGANDIPSVSDADVGIAVAHAVDALRETADIVLLSNGLKVISTAIRQARMVFMRLYHYSLYRVSSSVGLILTILILGLLIGQYPLTPIEVLLLAFLNDMPIISIAFDRVRIPDAPASIDRLQRTVLAVFYGSAAILASVSLFLLGYYYLHLPWGQLQTMLFLQMVVSGDMLIYIAHTRSTWTRFLPSRPVIIATVCTQLAATLWAAIGIDIPAIPFWVIGLVWVWAFFWMQVTAGFKVIADLLIKHIRDWQPREHAPHKRATNAA